MNRKAALISILLASATPAWAGDKPLYEAAPSWVTPAPPIDMSKVGDDAPIFLVIDQQQRLGEGQVWQYAESALRMASPQMLAQAGTIQLPWDPDKGDLIVHGASILRGGETINLLAGGKQLSIIRREQKLEQMQIDGLLTATMAVEGLRVGDVLRLRFSITRKDATLGNEVQSSAPLFTEPMRAEFGRIRIVWPAQTKLNWRSYAKWVKAAPTTLPNGDHELSISMPVAKPPEMPGDIPARLQPLPLIDATSYADWAAVGRTMAPLYNTTGLIVSGTPLAREVSAIAASSGDQRTRAAAALQLVQDKVRYLFNGMSQGNYKPQLPSETWSLRYGDCKAKTLLLLAILRELEIEAEAVAASSNLGDLVPSRLPMPGAFDHVLVRAVIGGESLWLDGTSSGDRLADLGNVPPFRHVLPLRDKGAELIALPMRASSRPEVDAELDFDQRAGIHLPAPFKAKVTMRGQVVQVMRGAAAAVGKDEIKRLTDGLVEEYVKGATLTQRQMSFDDTAGTVVITAAGVANPEWSRDDMRYKATLDSAVQNIGFSPDRSRTAWRELPVTTGEPAHVRLRTEYRLPRGGQGFVLEGDEKLPAQLAGRTLQRSVTLNGDILRIEDRTITTGAEVPPAEIGEVRRQLAQAKTRLLRAVAPADYPKRWDDAALARKMGGTQAILAAYGAGIAEDPSKAQGYSNRAWFYERTFDFPAAIRDLDKAIAAEPSVDTYLRRSALHDALGQFDKAIADADAARELDPGSSSAIQAVIRIRGHSGRRDEALAIADEQIGAGGKDRPTYQWLKAEVLAGASQTDLALETLDEAISASPGNAMLLNGRCWLKGTLKTALETALKDCTKAIELSDDPAAALDSRAMVYFRMDRLDEALGDLNAALETQPELAGSLYLRGVIRRKRGETGADADLAAARVVSPRIDKEYDRWGIAP